MKEKKLEIACFDLSSAYTAAKAGAHRLEFCHGLNEGGTTPSFEETKELVSKVTVPVFVMIRPRGGNFVYTQEEKDLMRRQVLHMKRAGVQGFVFGALNRDHTVDETTMSDLLSSAYPLPCTFHRAFDHTPGAQDTLETLITLGFKRVLTSGGKGNAVDHITSLAQLVEQAGDRITILPGGGIRSSGIKSLLATGAWEYHSSGIISASNGYADEEEIGKLLHALA